MLKTGAGLGKTNVDLAPKYFNIFDFISLSESPEGLMMPL